MLKATGGAAALTILGGIPLARAGAKVAHAGMIGTDGVWLKESLAADGADVTHLAVGDEPTGHAVIQVDASGQNCIIIFGGANRELDEGYVDDALAGFGPGDLLLLQNEFSL